MKCKDINVVNLNITEDHYEYKAVMRLCTENFCFDINLNELTDDTIKEVKIGFDVEESIDEMREIIMAKVMEASKIESRITEGQDCCKDDKKDKLQRSIDSLSSS